MARTVRNMKASLNEDARRFGFWVCFVVEIVAGGFDYRRRAVLAIPAGAVDGGDNEAHTAAVSALLPALLGVESGGSLVLFASRQQLERVREALPAALVECLLVQGALPVAEEMAKTYGSRWRRNAGITCREERNHEL